MTESPETPTAVLPPGPELTAEYLAKRARAAHRQKITSLAARDIGELPKVANRRRRESCRLNFRRFCEVYFHKTFTLKWSPDHLRVIGKIEEVTLGGGMHAHAMPRGSGKTSLCEAAVVWALMYEHRNYVAIVGPEHQHATDRIDNIRTELENNDLLLADFPEICYAIRKLDGIFQRRLMYQGRQIKQEFTAHGIAFSNLNGDRFAGGRVRATSMTGNIRGMVVKLPSGQQLRPSLVLLDDPQTDEAAKSPIQVAKLTATLNGAVLGLGGPDETISALLPCTVICEDDLADRLTDPERSPQWRGERTKMIYSLPTNEALWAEYAKLPAASRTLRDAFYKRNRKAMDEGAVVAWPQRHPGAVSGIQYAMNLKLDLGERAFAAEYQNDPLPEHELDGEQLRAEAIVSRLTGVPRGTVPLESTRLTAFVDVQAKALFWLVAAWGDGFSGSVIEYGVYPDQKIAHFALRDAKYTLATEAPGAGLEGSIRAGLVAIVNVILGRDWKQPDGTPLRVGRCLIDANWGLSTRTVYEFVRSSPHAAVLLPSHGKYFGPETTSLTEWRKAPGERVGLNWLLGPSKIRRQRRVLFDTNFWKSFVRARLQTAQGDPGALTLYGQTGKVDHSLLAQHLCAEFSTPTTGRGRNVDVWKMKRPDDDNHWLDCLVGAAVAASIDGVSVGGEAPIVVKRERVSWAAQQRAVREGR